MRSINRHRLASTCEGHITDLKNGTMQTHSNKSFVGRERGAVETMRFNPIPPLAW
jgi:hypothetical protein